MSNSIYTHLSLKTTPTQQEFLTVRVLIKFTKPNMSLKYTL